MNPIDLVEEVYRFALMPVAQVRGLVTDLRHWYQAFSATNYLQPCVIDGKAALICQKQLSVMAPQAYRALKVVCRQHDIYLKEDARTQASEADIVCNRRKPAVMLTFCLVMASAAQAANVNGQVVEGGGYAQVQPVSLQFKNQTLSSITHMITLQTGISFKFDMLVENDLIIEIRLNAQNWKDVLAQLLQNYNYSTIQDGNAIRTVFITGYKGGVKSATNGGIQQAPTTYLAADETADFFSHSASMDIDIPTEELANLQEGENMMVDLPVGVFNIQRQSMVAMKDGTLSWVGTMDCEEAFCRLYLTANPTGELLGNVFTAHGEYNIETVDGRTVMSAATHPGFAAANY